MMLELPQEILRNLLIDEDALQERIHDATQVLQLVGVDGRDEAAAAGAAGDAAAAPARAPIRLPGRRRPLSMWTPRPLP